MLYFGVVFFFFFVAVFLPLSHLIAAWTILNFKLSQEYQDETNMPKTLPMTVNNELCHFSHLLRLFWF